MPLCDQNAVRTDSLCGFIVVIHISDKQCILRLKAVFLHNPDRTLALVATVDIVRTRHKSKITFKSEFFQTFLKTSALKAGYYTLIISAARQSFYHLTNLGKNTGGIKKPVIILDEATADLKSNGSAADTPEIKARFLRGHAERNFFTRHFHAISAALDALELQPGELFCLNEAWLEEETMEEGMPGGSVPLLSFDAALRYVRNEMAEEEWTDDTLCWTKLENGSPAKTVKCAAPTPII